MIKILLKKNNVLVASRYGLCFISHECQALSRSLGWKRRIVEVQPIIQACAKSEAYYDKGNIYGFWTHFYDWLY